MHVVITSTIVSVIQLKLYILISSFLYILRVSFTDKFWFYFGLYFNFPTRVDNWAAFSDWMRDLEFWDKSKSILIIFKNIDELFCRNLTLQSLAMSVFWEEVLPYWENEVIKVTSGSMQPRQFDVYCVMSQYDDF